LKDFNNIEISIYRDSVLYEKVPYSKGLIYNLELDYEYFFKMTKPGYYNWEYTINTKKDTAKPSKDKSYRSIKNMNFAFLLVQKGLTQEKYAEKLKIRYSYDHDSKKFYSDLKLAKGDFIKTMGLFRLRTLLEENPVLNKEFEAYVKKIKLAEQKIQEEIYSNQLKQKEIEKKSLALNQTKILAEKKESELKIVEQKNEIQGLRLIEEQNKIIKRDIENIKKTKLIDSLHQVQLEKELDITNKELELNKSRSETEKKEQELKLKSTQVIILHSKEENQRIISYLIAIGLFIVLLFTFFIFNRLRVTKQQKKIIEYQKAEVEEAHKEIKDSIDYAKRIQTAILPLPKRVQTYFKESFILYKPKDVVAGDFYWLEPQNKNVLFAVADCTGHGVPGAMVSVICNNALNRSVREYALTDPGEILTKTREIVIQEFEKSDEEVKDGMDIALCSLEGNHLKYAGAHNPLLIIREGKIIETKGNKQPIGKFDNMLPFTTHFFELQKGDSIYAYTDGFVDQFGGEKGKKFKSRAFKELLLSVQDKAMNDQKNIIDDVFEKWRGNEGQIDDVCVMGIRI
ncbi:MAG: SpoIIE family protein phosphatase, partial [Vicingaceae bacterium]|nr:SpoIIE family protein phosphatase [Vicingaceae bacterium]